MESKAMSSFSEYQVTVREISVEYISNTIKYGFAETPFGEIMAAFLEEAVLSFYFCIPNKEKVLDRLKSKWKKANFIEDNILTSKLIDKMFNNTVKNISIDVIVKGTYLQIAVWKALTKIKKGDTKTYSEVASMIGKPKAVRSVASAVGKNEVSILIPCHRVVSKKTSEVKYGWGSNLKLQLLSFENTHNK